MVKIVAHRTGQQASRCQSDCSEEAHEVAVWVQREARELYKSLELNCPEGSTALANADRVVVLAAEKYQDALREFLAATALRPGSD